MTLGARVRRAREHCGLTQQELAGAELTKGLISQIEHGRTTPSVRTLDLFAQRLDRPFSYFLAGVERSLSQRVLGLLDLRGRDAQRRGLHEEALAAFADARTLAASHSLIHEAAAAAFRVGESFLGLRRFDDARAALMDAQDRARESADKLMETRVLHTLATVEHRSGRFSEAIVLYRKALSVVPVNAAPVLRGEVWLYLGTVLFRAGHLEEAWDANMQARRIFERARMTAYLGETVNNLGMVRYHGGRYDEAILLYEQALTLFEQTEDLKHVGWIKNNLGMALLALGRPRDALPEFSASLAMRRRLHDPVGECRVLTELARCHAVLGEFHRAREYAEDAAAKSREIGVPDELARAHLVLGALALSAGDPRKSQRYFRLVVEQAERASMLHELVAARFGLARTAASLGRRKDALEHYDRVMGALRQSNANDVRAALLAARLIDIPAGVRAPA